jgi:hypothetical protein
MKKLLLILLTVILFSCEKDSYCWECITTTKTTYLNTQYASRTDTETTSIEKCDLTKAVIKDFEGMYTFTTTNGNYKIVSVCNCKIK